MPRHELPRRTKRRLAVAGVAAVAIIGTTVTVGIMGIASARDNAAAPTQCLPEAPPASSEVPAPPPASSAPEEPAPPTESAPAESSEAPAQPPAEQPPAEQPPAEQPPAEQPPADPGATDTQNPTPANPENSANQGLTAPAAAQPSESPDEAGSPPAVQAPEVPDASAQQEFGNEDCAANIGPFATDYVNIRNVRASNLAPRQGRNASRGTFTALCGQNENKHNNPDNFIVAPGVRNGAQHTHDYVGNTSADANSTNENLVQADTTCRRGDLSTYYWPIIRVRAAAGEQDVVDEENPHNVGTELFPARAQLVFRGNATGRVVAMPRFLRDITGDAKAVTKGPANANAKWTCTGFTNRITTKYPLCPRGSSVMRILDFPSCWDGQNIDSANHRDHIKFPDAQGRCAAGTKAVPALQMRLTYNVPRGSLFVLDSFPDEKHSPLTDHGDFVNVMPEALMNQVVRCINTGRRC
ncbi:MAG TPA: DUF1996 domain-containing protein [Actinophytocola sp.]|jgi:hypothetical protein|uniref:DUF1996 domain-containing protein n=1 Tax=Actinophytocola sp. TaxID=1872138 RepID=UPI002F95BB99